MPAPAFPKKGTAKEGYLKFSISVDTNKTCLKYSYALSCTHSGVNLFC